MPAPQQVIDRVNLFSQFIDQYRSGQYNETQLRREFLDPLFEALGWDVTNKNRLPPAHREVVHEFSLKLGSATKAPDYCFRVGGTSRFFLEAKKPLVNIRDDVSPAYQLRRYAWSATLPVSILSDFEELAVYDCRVKPSPDDPAHTARIKYFTYSEYIERWDELAALFSRDAVVNGSLDQFAESLEQQRSTVTVDEAFLSDIESWRALIAQNLTEEHPDYDEVDLNLVIQSTIDRIIFLRMSEDRKIEPYGQLRSLLEGSDVFARLLQIFYRSDQRYNSGLFHFRNEKGRTEVADTVTPNLRLHDDTLKKVIASLYYPKSAYEFSVMPAAILGQVYEQFLGKVVRIKRNKAVVEEKPEIRKAGGVYYTPDYVVDYIVKKSLDSALVGKNPRGIADLRVLDPACGSGSFLIAAYQHLLDWYRDFYVNDGPEQHTTALFQTKHGEWRLSSTLKKRILLRHIYGVDVDQQAVEVTKLSLLLKVLEGETDETLKTQLQFWHERALPDLGDNVKCGNAIIDIDFYEAHSSESLDPADRIRINPFNWAQEFPKVLGARVKRRGFDVVIGNPPYRRELDYKHLMDEVASTKFGKEYRAPRMDLWYYFVHRSLELLRRNGTLSFITNSYWTSGTGAEKLIRALHEETTVQEIFSLRKLKVFRNVSGQHMIFRIAKNTAPAGMTLVRVVGSNKEKDAKPFVQHRFPVLSFEKSKGQLFQDGKIDLEPPADELLRKLEQWPTLVKMGTIRQGIAENPQSINKKTNEKFGRPWEVGEGVFALKHDELQTLQIPQNEAQLLRPYHDLSDLGRYRISPPSLTLIYSTKNTCPDITQFPTIEAHLRRFKPIMSERRETENGSNQWWHLHWPRDERIWQAGKVLALQMSSRPSFVFSNAPVYVPFSVNVFVPGADVREKLEYLTALLNSRVLWKWFQHRAKRRGIALEINGNVLERVPMRRIDFNEPADVIRHDQLVALVRKRLLLESQRAKATAPPQQVALDRQIKANDDHIDRIVYALYQVSDHEAALVESATTTADEEASQFLTVP